MCQQPKSLTHTLDTVRQITRVFLAVKQNFVGGSEKIQLFYKIDIFLEVPAKLCLTAKMKMGTIFTLMINRRRVVCVCVLGAVPRRKKTHQTSFYKMAVFFFGAGPDLFIAMAVIGYRLSLQNLVILKVFKLFSLKNRTRFPSFGGTICEAGGTTAGPMHAKPPILLLQGCPSP